MAGWVRLRQGYGATQPPGGFGPIYVSAKRTHRFSVRIFMQLSLYWHIAEKIHAKFRWVRFGKRTHRERLLVGFGCRDNYFAACRRTPLGKRTHRRGVFERASAGKWESRQHFVPMGS